MSAAKKTTGAQFLLHWVHSTNFEVGKKTGIRAPGTRDSPDDVFVLAQDLDKAKEIVEDDWYGLARRGFECVGRYRLAPLEQAIGRLPQCGVYEGARWIYLEYPREEKDQHPKEG